MDVFLLPAKSGGHFLYADAPEEPLPRAGDGEPAIKKIWYWVRATHHRWTRRARNKELVVKSLAHIVRLRLVYPSILSRDEANASMRGWLLGEVSRHKRWLFVDAVAFIVSIPLSFIPGPNVLLAYLGWRTAMHYKARKAGRYALSLPVDWAPNDALLDLRQLVAQPRSRDRDMRVRTLGDGLGLVRLDRAY